MITDNIKNHLLERDEKSHLDFKGLVSFLEDSDFSFVDAELHQARGMATIDNIYLDLTKLEYDDDQLVFFIILHEYCHGIRMKRIGKKTMISFLSEEDFDVMFEHVVGEEVLADRYGSFMYYQFNKEEYPRYRTQRLTETVHRVNYKDRVRPLHGMIKNSEENYNRLMESFII